MDKPKLLDLFCGAGGCARGYQMAGFHVTGIDIKHQPRYAGDVFIRADALEYVTRHGHEYDAIHASPPCQGYSDLKHRTGKEYPRLIEAVRYLLVTTGKPYIIENVPGAPLKNPVTLVGSMFGLMTMRPRLFETSFNLPFVLAPPPGAKHAKMGRKPKPGEYVHVAGHVSDTDYCRQAMSIDWMTRNELVQAIPPAYTHWIGQHLIQHLSAQGEGLGGRVGDDEHVNALPVQRGGDQSQ